MNASHLPRAGKEPSFDVIITTYRRPEYVVAAVRSCLSQGPHLHQVIVVDDASGDDTEHRIAEIGDPRIVFWCRPENGGMSASRHDALAMSSADWTIRLDDDWELVPGAIEAFATLAERAPANCVMLGARMKWDTGGEFPAIVPTEPIDYVGQIQWRNRPGGLGRDNVCAVSRLVREHENWAPVRFGSYCATLFYLDAARHGVTLYTEDVLALQHRPMNSASRGNAEWRLARRKLDANGGIAVAEWILERHGSSLAKHGRRVFSRILAKAAMCQLLTGHRAKAFTWSLESWWIHPANVRALGMAMSSVLGRRVFEMAYRLRG